MTTQSLGTRLLAAVLRAGGLRRRLAFHLKQHHFADLQMRIPIGQGLVCPVGAEENLMSFGEIFGEREYEALLREIPPPRRWLDVGAHAGYFSLMLAARLLQEGVDGWEALLVEPDPRLRRTIEAGLAQPGLRNRARFLPAAVGAGGVGELPFALRSGMVSSLDAGAAQVAQTVAVPIASEAEIAARLAPPYDLLKLDVEGAEYDFVRDYGALCRGARALVVEWHADHETAPRIAELRANLARHGLTGGRALRGLHRSGGNGPLAVSGLELFTREADGRAR